MENTSSQHCTTMSFFIFSPKLTRIWWMLNCLRKYSKKQFTNNLQTHYFTHCLINEAQCTYFCLILHVKMFRNNLYSRNRFLFHGWLTHCAHYYRAWCLPHRMTWPRTNHVLFLVFQGKPGVRPTSHALPQVSNPHPLPVPTTRHVRNKSVIATAF